MLYLSIYSVDIVNTYIQLLTFIVARIKIIYKKTLKLNENNHRHSSSFFNALYELPN